MQKIAQKRKKYGRYKRIQNLVIKQTVIAMMQKLTRNIQINKLNKFRCNFTTEYSEQPLKFPISARHCSMLTGVIPYNKQPSYMNPMQQ